MVRRAIAISMGALLTGAVAAGPAEDSEIAQKIVNEFRRSPAVGQLRLSAKARDGRAILEGRAPTLALAWQATDLAGKVRGVLEIENRIEIESRGGRNDLIASAVRRRFEERPAVAAAGLEVKVEDGAVTLAGKVRDGRTRFAAVDAAADVPGVLAVSDRIETPAQDDDAIRKTVTKLLGASSLVHVSRNIVPTVKDGTVTLEGRVERLYDRKLAERLVLGVNGVRGVTNRLDVKPASRDLLIPLD